MEEHKPPWLVRAENGSIAEARTRAFLIDRFWILERSVDVEGADFIIQRRLTSRTILDKTPPRLGIVQVKFFNNEKTTQYIHREYVVNYEGEPREEFFVICHTGFENSKRAFFISASQVVESFRVVPEGQTQEGKYNLPGRDILKDKKYEIIDADIVLNRIERALEKADFAQNRKFLSWALPSTTISPTAIDDVYCEPLDNYWGDIPEAFYEMKKKARSAAYRVEDAFYTLSDIVESSDPEIALEKADALYHEHGHRISLPDDLYDEDFWNVVQIHKNKCNKLREAGLLDQFLSLRSKFFDFSIKDIAPKIYPPTYTQRF